LCSDAFSGFIRGDENEFEHNQEVREATDHLLNVLIPKFAARLEKLMQDARDQNRLQDFRLTETIHTVGINCRHMGMSWMRFRFKKLLMPIHDSGLLRQYIKDEDCRRMILAEATARVIKNNLRFKLRGKMKLIKLPLEEPYRYYYCV